MTLEDRIRARVTTYREQAQKLELQGVASREPMVREVLLASGLWWRQVADALESDLDAQPDTPTLVFTPTDHAAVFRVEAVKG